MTVIKEKRMHLQALLNIIIVTYNSECEIEKCIDSIFNGSYKNLNIIIVDNASQDSTPKKLKSIAENHVNVEVILNLENRGLASANNQAFNLCSGDFILILNPDTILQSNTLELMVKYLHNHSDVGIVGCKNIYENGKPHRSFFRDWTIYHILLWRLCPNVIIRNIDNKFTKYEEANVLFVSGACLLIRYKLFRDIEGYDEYFFLSVEDAADLCLRAREKGYRTVFFPKAEVTHLGGRSHRPKPGMVLYYGFQGSIYFLKKNRSNFQSQSLRIILIANTIYRIFYSFVLSFWKHEYKEAIDWNFDLMKCMLKKQSFTKRLKKLN